MKPKQVMDCCPIVGNPMAVRMYPTGGRVLAVMGASGGTNIPDQSSSDCPDLSVYLREDLSACVAAVSLKTGVRWNSMFVRVQLKDGRAVAEMEEPFVHPRYPTTFDGWRVCVQVAGEWYATTTLNLVAKVVTAESICKLLAGTMTKEAFIASAEGESLTDKLARLEKKNAELYMIVKRQGDLLRELEGIRAELQQVRSQLFVEQGAVRNYSKECDKLRREFSDCRGRLAEIGSWARNTLVREPVFMQFFPSLMRGALQHIERRAD